MTGKDLMLVKKETVDIVLKKVQELQNTGELDIPASYSAANALKSAWLIIQEAQDKDKKYALEVCSKISVTNAMLDMVVQGLNPAKKQCYFIVYGNRLVMQRSYLGSKAVCMRVDSSLSDIYAEVVYHGDTLEYRIDRGVKIVEVHKQKLENIDDSKIIAAYAVAVGNDGEVKRSEIMTMAQIKKAWSKSKMYPINKDGSIKAGSVHDDFTGEMAKKTVTSRLAKHIIGSSGDDNLMMRSITRTPDESALEEAEHEIMENANSGDVIDITPEPPPVDGTGLTDDEKKQIAADEAKAADGPPF